MSAPNTMRVPSRPHLVQLRCRSCGRIVRLSLTGHLRLAHGIRALTREACMAQYEAVT